MSQYGGQQQYGGAQGGQGGQGGYNGQQDPSQQDPSQSQYGAQQGQGGYDQQQQDPSQQDPSQQNPSQHQDPSQSQYGAQSNGYASTGGDEQANPSQQQDPSQLGQDQGQHIRQPAHKRAMTKKDTNKDRQVHAAPKSGPTRKWDKNHHNAMYHQSKTAAGGFTKDHMESFIHLGTYALGALSNQHGLAPDAPHEDENESAMA